MKELHCPIFYEKLKYPFISIKATRIFNYYDFTSLIKYFHKTSDFRDPMTRIELSDNKIRDILWHIFRNKITLIAIGKYRGNPIICRDQDKPHWVKMKDINKILIVIFNHLA